LIAGLQRRAADRGRGNRNDPDDYTLRCKPRPWRCPSPDNRSVFQKTPDARRVLRIKYDSILRI
jgi:hypothetical protein